MHAVFACCCGNQSSCGMFAPRTLLTCCSCCPSTDVDCLPAVVKDSVARTARTSTARTCQLACSSVLQIQSLHWGNTILIHGPVYRQTVVLQWCPASSYTASCSCDHGCALSLSQARSFVHVIVVAGVKNSPALAPKGVSVVDSMLRSCVLVGVCVPCFCSTRTSCTTRTQCTRTVQPAAQRNTIPTSKCALSSS